MQDIIQPMVGCRRFCIIGKSRTMAAKKTTILESRVRNRLADIHQTQAWLAEKMELSDAAISKWLTGQSDPQFSRLRELAKHLQCSIGYLVGDHQDDMIAEAVRLMEKADPQTRAKIVTGIAFMVGSATEESRTLKKAASFQ